MDIKQIAAKVNLLRDKRLSINWKRVRDEYNEEEHTHYTDQELKSYYEKNHTADLDSYYIIDRIVGFSQEDPNIVQIEWQGFPIDKNESSNYVKFSIIEIPLFVAFYEKSGEEEFKTLSKAQLNYLLQHSEDQNFNDMLKRLISGRTSVVDNKIKGIEERLRNREYPEIQFEVISSEKYINFKFSNEIVEIPLAKLKRSKRIANFLIDFGFNYLIQVQK